MDINKYFKKAKSASTLSDFPKHKLGACLVYKNYIVSVGYNTKKTNPIQHKYNALRGYNQDTKNNGAVHAEMACMINTRDLDIDFSKANLFIYRSHKDGSNALAKPCPACMQMIKDMGIKNIYYTSEDGYCHEYINARGNNNA